jgi:enoyl-CoA hydratase
MSGVTEFETVRNERPVSGVARIVLNRPETRNAQDKKLLYELTAAMDEAARDSDVRVVILAAEGPHFSSGHDLRDSTSMSEFDPVSTWGGFDQPGMEGYFATEEELYLALCWRWRNVPKPTIAQVHGRVIAGGLMLVWPCDLIIASDDAEFSDPVVALGANAVEYFVHPYEVGARKAKQMLFTGEAISAQEAHRLGMVNEVVPRAELAEFTLSVAERIARRPPFALKLAKQSVNQTLELQGLWSSVQAAFGYHQLAHAHNMLLHGQLIDLDGVDLIRRGE